MGWKLPGFVVQDLLGTGASGEVWRGVRIRTGETVALKRLATTGAGQLQAAQGEAAMLSALDHPHLIRLHDVVATVDATVLVLDLADGGSLAGLLRRRGRLTPGEVITALAPIGAALAYAHGHGVVHGDVSAGNVLFTAIGLPLLSDLGLARIIGDGAPIRGTPAYIDPAVANGFVPGPPSDVFSVAALAVHALTGRPLWPGDRGSDMIAAAGQGAVGDLAERLRELPLDLRTLLQRALSVSPQLRGTAAEFALDLRHSATPAPIELQAGRQRPEPPAQRSPRVDFDRPDFDRPDFERPQLSTAAGGEAGLITYGRRIAAPRREPPNRLRLAGLRFAELRQRWAVRCALVVAAAMVVAVAAVTVVTWAQAPRGVPAGSLTDAASAARVLAALDVLRERAYAERDATLLTHVYIAGPLLDQDVAELDRLVKPNCSMVGVATTYTGIRLLTALPARPTVLTTATLAPATVHCAGTAAAMSLGSAPTTLRIELVRSGGGYLIAAQQVVS